MINSPLFFSQKLRQTESAAAGLSLMHRAGEASTSWILKHYPAAQIIYVLAGPGNNGGDALITASLLQQAGKTILLRLTSPCLTADAKDAFAKWQASGGQTITSTPDQADLAIDGLFGLGLNRAPSEADGQIMAGLQALGCPIIALDIPSGLMADSGAAPGAVIHATHTLSFISHKPGLFTARGCDVCGEISQHDLQIPAHLYPEADGYLQNHAPASVGQLLRNPDSHKGSYGTVGVMGGASGMLGAALLAGRAALHMGAGRVVLGLLDKTLSADPVQPELMLYTAEEALQHPALSFILTGPGLGNSATALAILQQSIASPLPLLLDADALNLLASSAELTAAMQERSSPSIITPHPAEAARLLHISTQAVQANRIESALTLARRYKATVLLKGAGSVCSDGQSWSINASGNAALASAGQGDVLSGIIAALAAQGLKPLDAVQSGSWLHGRAADDWSRIHPNGIGLTASETIVFARAALNQVLGAS
ncbi:NAD(P)H-hydrate dehydratase [Iodobacter sp. LRB]|uniref:NAD(P)H-hydrate dehydratase n=1 Tax=unclassified Iodobacter TaxID=235634 RepID=UPI000C0C9028|nr:NAD(P)H-hydrate dehydratase [Iodobacter sp. BJB302]PHV00365.1 bifunctional ADP-dependent NAD(P)H-hydrate dehydratase/NAD(P)H-hydrate epimerase [Iodobacter sp. BJB302]